MNFEKFINTVKDTIKDYLPEDYKDADVRIIENRKLNTSYVGLTVTRKGANLAPTINLNRLFDNYLQHPENTLEKMMEEVAEVIRESPERFDMERLLDYEQAKQKLFMKVSSAEKNADVLEHAPHVLKEDLAITFHIMLDQNEQGTATTMITEQIMESYGVDTERLYQDALLNSPLICPVQIENLSETLGKMMIADMKSAGTPPELIQEMEKDLKESSKEDPMTIVTNDRSTDGASAIFYPGVMDLVGEKMKGDYFIIPSSVHETLVVPDDGTIAFQELKDMVMDVNHTQVKPEEQLSDQVYHYDIAERIFEKAETFAERKQAKEAEMEEKGVSKEKGVEKQNRPEKTKHRSAEMAL